MNTFPHWTAVWGNAISVAEHRPESYAKNLTLRYNVPIPFAGDTLRLTFDNFCGDEPVTITRAAVALADGDRAVCPDTRCFLRFGGSQSLTLGPGERRVCDPLPFAAPAGRTLAVTFYLQDFTAMQSAVYVQGPCSAASFAVGDFTDADALDPERTKNTHWVYFLSQVDLRTAPENRALVCYGDSITAQDWPDYLTLRARSLGAENVAVVRRAASGTRILRQYSCIQYDSYGLKGSVRFPHELPVCGARDIIIQQGINDIIHPVGVEVNPFRPWSDLPTVEQLAAGLQWYLDRAHAIGMRAYLGTLLPIAGWRTYAPFREQLRRDLNDWMRACPDADGCIDFDAALRDPERPEAFRPEFDSGDHLHPSAAGYRVMAETVPEALLR